MPIFSPSTLGFLPVCLLALIARTTASPISIRPSLVHKSFSKRQEDTPIVPASSTGGDRFPLKSVLAISISGAVILAIAVLTIILIRRKAFNKLAKGTTGLKPSGQPDTNAELVPPPSRRFFGFGGARPDSSTLPKLAADSRPSGDQALLDAETSIRNSRDAPPGGIVKIEDIWRSIPTNFDSYPSTLRSVGRESGDGDGYRPSTAPGNASQDSGFGAVPGRSDFEASRLRTVQSAEEFARSRSTHRRERSLASSYSRSRPPPSAISTENISISSRNQDSPTRAQFRIPPPPLSPPPQSPLPEVPTSPQFPGYTARGQGNGTGVIHTVILRNNNLPRENQPQSPREPKRLLRKKSLKKKGGSISLGASATVGGSADKIPGSSEGNAMEENEGEVAIAAGIEPEQILEGIPGNADDQVSRWEDSSDEEVRGRKKKKSRK